MQATTTVHACPHWIESSRGRLYAKRWTPTGEHQGAPVVLLHDSLGCVSMWRNFPHRLAAASGREVIAYDRLGFGEYDFICVFTTLIANNTEPTAHD